MSSWEGIENKQEWISKDFKNPEIVKRFIGIGVTNAKDAAWWRDVAEVRNFEILKWWLKRERFWKERKVLEGEKVIWWETCNDC